MRLQGGTLTLDLKDRTLYLNGNGADPVRLFPMEARLLAALMESPGRILSRAELMRTVWQTDYVDDTRTLDVHICWLRHKIERDPSRPQHILTHRGRGYQFKV